MHAKGYSSYSYSQHNNQAGRIDELKRQIEADYRSFTGSKLICFFDVDPLDGINAMDDWRNRILGGLRKSNLLLLVLSPAYLDSPYLRKWEMVKFFKYEHSRRRSRRRRRSKFISWESPAWTRRTSISAGPSG